MNYFNLPKSTEISKVIPKNAFDSYTNTAQKKLFTNKVHKIVWMHKIAQNTVNLPYSLIEEIQVFEISLKEKVEIGQILDIIDKSIPYHIIFIIFFEDEVYISASKKHLHAVKNDISVIDWTFKTEWFPAEKKLYQIELKKDLDTVFSEFCGQLSQHKANVNLPIETLIQKEEEVYKLQQSIKGLKSKISKCKQFNKKVELNQALRLAEKKLNILMN